MRRLILRITGFAVDLYYRRRHFGEAIPASGPLLLVANHPNGLVDAAVIACTTARPVRFLGKEPLFRMPVLGHVVRAFGAVPVYRASDGADTSRNARTFEAVHEALAKGDAVCLFPEGKSHSEPALQELKTGAARMALGGEAARAFTLGVRIVPIGLVYRAKRRFGSVVTTWVGPPIELADLKEAHGADPFAAARTLTERIAAGLRDVTLELDRWEDLGLFEIGERILAPHQRPDVRRLRAFAEGARRLREHDRERLARLTERVETFRDRLRRLGLSVDDLDVRYRPGLVLRYVAKNLTRLVLATPPALVGLVAWFLPYRAVPIVARLARPTRDIHATVQILAGMVIFPLWTALLCVLAGLRYGWPAAVAVLVALPPLGVLALVYARRARTNFADASAFVRTSPRAGLRAALLREREQLAEEILALAHELELLPRPS